MNGKKDIKALVVDDEKIIRDFLLHYLGYQGILTTAVENGRKAIEIAQKEKFDLFFLDIRMPGMDGVEAFRQIKKHNPEGVYVMITGYAVDDLLREAIAEGAVAALKKPFDLKDVQVVIKNALKHKGGDDK